MKLIVKTTGSFMLVDPQTHSEIACDRPSVVSSSNFIQSRTGTGQLEILNNKVPDEATDSEFQKFWVSSEGNQALAIESFLSSFEPAPEAKKPAAKTAKVPE